MRWRELSPTLYHSGLSGDVGAVMRHFLARERLQSISLAGYSMGGNLVLKYAGELGADAPRELHSVIGVSPAIDLGPSATALHRAENRIYEWRFLRALLKRYRGARSSFFRRHTMRTGRTASDRCAISMTASPRSIPALQSAEDYYYRASAARVVERIAVPTLILHSLDDPFVTITPETLEKLHANPKITLVQPALGGHCAFLARRSKPGVKDTQSTMATGRSRRCCGSSTRWCLR